MTLIIKNMLEKNKSNDKLNNLIYQGTRLKETNLYLHNLDLKAKIEEGMYLTPSDTMKLALIQTDNDNLFKALQQNLIHITKNLRVTQDEFENFIKRLKYLIEEDIDFVSLSKANSTQACRIYIVARAITDQQFQQKYIYQLNNPKQKTL